MLRTLRPIGQLLAQRTSGMTTVSNGPTEPVTVAALQFMADVVKSNREDRHRMDEQFKESLEKFSSSLDSLRAEVSSFKDSQNSLRTEFSSLKDSQNSLRTEFSSLRTELHSLDKKVTSIVAISSFVVSLVTVGGVAIRAGLVNAPTAPVVAKIAEEVALTPWYHFW